MDIKNHLAPPNPHTSTLIFMQRIVKEGNEGSLLRAANRVFMNSVQNLANKKANASGANIGLTLRQNAFSALII